MSESTNERFIWNIEKIRTHQNMSWNYIDGCMFTSLLELYRVTKDPKSLNFVKKCIDTFIEENGNIRTYDYRKFSLDDICESRVLFTLFQFFGEEKYLKAINNTYQHIKLQPRTQEGNFWHKLIYPNQVWLDGLYMVMPFYLQYLNMIGDYQYDDIVNQYENVYRNMFDKNKKLYYHGYDATRTIFWANKETGLSKSFWLRSMGWYLVSMVDVFEYSKNEAFNQMLQKRIKELIDSLLSYQDQKTCMFYQVVDLPTQEGNYLETSGSAMIAYAVLKSVRLGILTEEYHQMGKNIFYGICNKYLKEVNGSLSLGGICLVAGLGPEGNMRRDGTYEYYLSEPIVENDAKGVAPFIMAYVEIIRSKL